MHYHDVSLATLDAFLIHKVRLKQLLGGLFHKVNAAHSQLSQEYDIFIIAFQATSPYVSLPLNASQLINCRLSFDHEMAARTK
jgi:hypothetical protein